MTEQSAPSFKLWWLSINTNKDANGAPVYISPTMWWGDIVRQKKIAHINALRTYSRRMVSNDAIG
jgi:hypothetical protein